MRRLPLLNNPKLLGALFSAESLKERRNTELVEVAPGKLVVARVIEHKAPAARPFEEVKAQIVKDLTEREAASLAKKAGMERLRGLQAGKDAGAGVWSPSRAVTARTTPRACRRPVWRRFSASIPRRFPRTRASKCRGGYSIIRLNRVSNPVLADDNRLKSVEFGLARQAAREDYEALAQGLRARAKVDINAANFEKKPARLTPGAAVRPRRRRRCRPCRPPPVLKPPST